LVLAFLILGIPEVFLAGGLTFLLSWLPMIGSAPMWLVGAIYLFAKSWTGKLVILLAFGLLTVVVDNIVRPMVLKGSAHMHPLISLVAILGGINMFGVFGV